MFWTTGLNSEIMLLQGDGVTWDAGCRVRHDDRGTLSERTQDTLTHNSGQL